VWATRSRCAACEALGAFFDTVQALNADGKLLAITYSQRWRPVRHLAEMPSPATVADLDVDELCLEQIRHELREACPNPSCLTESDVSQRIFNVLSTKRRRGVAGAAQ